MTRRLRRAAASTDDALMVFVDAALRRVRTLAAGVLMFQLAGLPRKPVPFGPPTFAIAATVAAFLIAANMLSLANGRATGPTARSVLSALVLAADAASVVLVVSGLRPAEAEVVWAMLVIPVLEGALRFRLRGAVLCWLGATAAYVTLEVAGRLPSASQASQETFLTMIQTLVERSAVILLVAIPGGYLADQLLRAIVAQRRARMDAVGRSSLLKRVVDAGRGMGRLDGTAPAIEPYALTLGFDVVDVCRLDRGDWLPDGAAPRSPDTVRLPSPREIEPAIALAMSGNTTVLIGGEDEDPALREVLAGAGLGMIVLCPILGRTRTTAMLRAGVRAGKTVSTHQIESLQLLAGQAAVVVDNIEMLRTVREAQERLEHQAHHDALTGLPNQVLFHERVRRALGDSGDEPSSIAVLFLDLDRFKEVNDTWGHHIGDKLLVAAAKRMRRCLRDDDLVARLSGDEFTMLLKVSSSKDAQAAAARLCTSISRPYRLGGHDAVVSASIGIAIPDGPVTVAEIMRRADLAMYRAKEQGRDQWRVYSDELDREVADEVMLRSGIRRALADEAFLLAYQPIMEADGRTPYGMEALLRWNDPELGWVPPDRFVRVAEDSGQILELGAWVLREACRQAVAWKREHRGRPLTMSVNVSPHQLMRPDFADVVASTLHSTGMDPESLVLEITERILIATESNHAIEQVRALGVRVAVDDFGRGQTSMFYLRKLPLDVLKIDRSLVDGIAEQPTSKAIVKSIIGLSHDLGMTVVAEGVESERDHACLRRLGCDAVQGFLFHKPLAPALVPAVLRTQTRAPAARARRPRRAAARSEAAG